MTNTFTTNFWGWDGSGKDWVEYPKGFNKDGKAIINGLSSEAGHAYTVAEGFWDATGIEADMAINAGQYANNASKKAKKAAFADPFEWETDYYSTDTKGFKFLGQYNGKDPEAGLIVADGKSSCPITKWDAEGAALAVADQVKTFGEFFFGVKNASESKKVVWKEAALDKALDAAFNKKESTGAKYIDTTKDVDWYPASADPIEEMIEAEEKVESWMSVMAKAKKALTSDEWAMVIAKANGMNQTAIAVEWGVSKMAISKKFKVIAKKATKATGVAFVAA